MAFDLNGKALRKLRLPTTNYIDSSIQLVPAQTGDTNSRFFSIVLYDDRGNIDLTQYTDVRLNVTLLDETVEYTEGEIADGVIHCKLSSSMLSEAGTLMCDIELFGIDGNGEATSLTSQTFYVNVSGSQSSGDDTEGDENYNILVSLIADVRNLESMVETAEEYRTTAEESRAAAEELRVTAEEQREINENTRILNESERTTAEEHRVSAFSIMRNSVVNRSIELLNKRVYHFDKFGRFFIH